MLLSCETVSFKDYITQDCLQYWAVTQCVATDACVWYNSIATAHFQPVIQRVKLSTKKLCNFRSMDICSKTVDKQRLKIPIDPKISK